MSKAESVLTDLSIVEDVLNGLIDKANEFGRLMPEHVNKLEKIAPDIERARLFAIEEGDGILEGKIAESQKRIDSMTGRETSWTSQKDEIDRLKTAKKMIIDAQEAI